MSDVHAPSFRALPKGAQLEHYVIDTVLGMGGFGVTYLARHARLDQPCCIKEHFPHAFAVREGSSDGVIASDGDMFARTHESFQVEARRLSQCRHDGIVRVEHIFQANNTSYMVLAYEEGKTFEHWLRDLGRRPTQAEIDAILAPLLDALDFVHSQGILHGAISPDSIMIKPNGMPVLIEFGSAEIEAVLNAFLKASRISFQLIRDSYIPIECSHPVGLGRGPWSDIYALAATLYRAVVGGMPPGATQRAIEGELPITQELDDRHGYRPGFLAAIDTAMRSRAADRPQTVDQWREALWKTG